MSYILDALRKSEAQRHQSEPVSGAPATPLWAAADSGRHDRRAVILLLLTGLAVVLALIWNLISYSRPQDDPAVLTAAAVPSEPRAEMTTATLNSRPQPVVVTATKPADTSVMAAEPVSQVADDSTQVLPATISTPTATPRTMPPLDALRRIPQLMINSHIYSPVAAKRSVIMNNREWHEGDYVAEGVVLREITPDGIMLDVDGWPVHVGRSKGWDAMPGND